MESHGWGQGLGSLLGSWQLGSSPYVWILSLKGHHFHSIFPHLGASVAFAYDLVISFSFLQYRLQKAPLCFA